MSIRIYYLLFKLMNNINIKLNMFYIILYYNLNVNDFTY